MMNPVSRRLRRAVVVRDEPARVRAEGRRVKRVKKTAVVTGGASGIGRAVAAELLRRGVHVTIADVRGAEETAGELGCAGVVCDVSDAAAVRELVTGVAAEHGRLD